MSIIFNATFETDTDHHVDWFSTTTVRTTTDAHGGTGSLSVTLLDPFAGVQLDNWPYFSGAVAASNYDCSVWAKRASGTTASILWHIIWYDNTVTAIRTDTITITFTGSWAQTATTLTAPAGTTTVGWNFDTNGAGVTSDVLLFDDLLIADAVAAAPPPRSPLVLPSLAATQASTW